VRASCGFRRIEGRYGFLVQSGELHDIDRPASSEKPTPFSCVIIVVLRQVKQSLSCTFGLFKCTQAGGAVHCGALQLKN
jgi:hypothetical protein